MAFSTQRQFFYFPTYYNEDECKEYNCIKLRSYDIDERSWHYSEDVKSQFLQDKVSRIINEEDCENQLRALLNNEYQRSQNNEETLQEENLPKIKNGEHAGDILEQSDINSDEDIDEMGSEEFYKDHNKTQTGETVNKDYKNKPEGNLKKINNDKHDRENSYIKSDEDIDEEDPKDKKKRYKNQLLDNVKEDKSRNINKRKEQKEYPKKHDKGVQQPSVNPIENEYTNETPKNKDKAVQTHNSKEDHITDTAGLCQCKSVQTLNPINTLGIKNSQKGQAFKLGTDDPDNSSTSSINEASTVINQNQVPRKKRSWQTRNYNIDSEQDSSTISIHDDSMTVEQYQETKATFALSSSDYDSDESEIAVHNVDFRNTLLSDLKKVLHCLLNCKLKKNTKDMLVRIYCQAKALVHQYEHKSEQIKLNANCKQKCNIFFEELEFKSEKSADIPYLQEQVNKLRCEVDSLQKIRIEEIKNMESKYRNMYHDQLNALNKQSKTCQELDEQIEDLKERARRAKLLAEDNSFVCENKMRSIKQNPIIKSQTAKKPNETVDNESCPLYTARDMEVEKQNLHDSHLSQIKQLQSNIKNLEMELNKYKAELSVTKCEAKIESDKYNDLLNYVKKKMQQMN